MFFRPGDLKGQYYPLTGSNSYPSKPGGMSKEERKAGGTPFFFLKQNLCINFFHHFCVALIDTLPKFNIAPEKEAF